MGKISLMNQDSVRAGCCLCPAKINLDLEILGRRADGYHLLRSDMVPLSVGDRLELTVDPARTGVELEVTGREAPSGPDNLVWRAASLFLERTGISTGVRMRLTKELPSGAGLGGGSSDAAATLRLLAALLQPEIERDRLLAWALELGADVPFFIDGRPATIAGIGEQLTPLQDWPKQPLVVAFRGPGLATAEVYRRFDASLTSTQSASSIPVFPRFLGGKRRNDLESAACQIDPAINSLKECLLSHGACEVGMSGSGSAVFGFFAESEEAQRCSTRMSENGDWARTCEILGESRLIETWSVESQPSSGR